MHRSPSDWVVTDVNAFWAEIAHSKHVLQVYQNDGVFIDALAGFVLDGIQSHETVVVIATNAHLNTLESRLASYGLDIEALISEREFIPFNVEEVLAEFVVDGLPDETLFKKAANKLFREAGYNERSLRLFGEGTAMLWHMGYPDGALKLENLWCEFHEQHPHTLFCAYSEQMFEAEGMGSTLPICALHSKIISGTEKQVTHIFYRQVA